MFEQAHVCVIQTSVSIEYRDGFECMYAWSIKTPAEKVDANSLLCDHFAQIHVSHNSKMQNIQRLTTEYESHLV